MQPGLTAYLVDLGPDDRLRVSIHTDRGQVLYFTVQYETRVGGKWHPVVRYDSSHGTPHRDLLNADGTVRDKLWLPARPIKQALDEAAADLKTNWMTYRADFLRRMP
jgi:hypothetical protein